MHMRAKTISGFALILKSLCDITIFDGSYPTFDPWSAAGVMYFLWRQLADVDVAPVAWICKYFTWYRKTIQKNSACTEKQYLNVSKFLKMTVDWSACSFSEKCFSNGGARSAEVPESCTSVAVAVGCRILLNLRTRGDSENTAVRSYVICKMPDRVKARS